MKILKNSTWKLSEFLFYTFRCQNVVSFATDFVRGTLATSISWAHRIFLLFSLNLISLRLGLICGVCGERVCVLVWVRATFSAFWKYLAVIDKLRIVRESANRAQCTLAGLLIAERENVNLRLQWFCLLCTLCYQSISRFWTTRDVKKTYCSLLLLVSLSQGSSGKQYIPLFSTSFSEQRLKIIDFQQNVVYIQ